MTKPFNLSQHLTREYVSPLDFGAPCNGVDDDYPALQEAFTYAASQGKPLTLRNNPGGWWRISQGIDGSVDTVPGDPNPHSWAMPTVIEGCGALIQALPGYVDASGAMLSLINATNSAMHDLTLDGNAVATRALDTSWTYAAAPSRLNRYDGVTVRNCAGADSTIWLATSDNDSNFESCLFIGIPGEDQKIALDASGGHLRFNSPTIFDCVIEYSCQSITIHDGITHGIRAFNADDNVTVFSGNGYHYAANTGINIEIAAGARIVALKASGRFENSAVGGSIIGGAGALCGGAGFEDCYIFRSSGAAIIPLVGPGITSIAGGYKQIVRVTGGSIQNITYANTTDVLIALDGVFSAGVLLSIIPEGALYGMDRFGSYWKWRNPGWGSYGGGAQASSPSATGGGATVNVPTTNFPQVGVLSISTTNGSCPGATFAYDLVSGITQLIKNFPRAAFPAAVVTCTISGGNFVLGHNAAGQDTIFLLSASA